MATKLVYDPSEDRRKTKGSKVFTMSQGNEKKTVEYQAKAKNALRGKAVAKKAEEPKKTEQKKPSEKPQRATLKFTDEQLIEDLKAIGHLATSREISDKLGIADPDQGRAYVRREMARLMGEGKIKGKKQKEKAREKLVYSVA